MNDIEKFLEEYSLIDSEKNLNFFQIAEFPHWENVSSNILSFLLKFPLVLRIFLDCVQWTDTGASVINYDISNDKINDIIREKNTKENNRIDIVVKTNKYIVGIENKIEAPPKNPFRDYKSELDEMAKGTGKKVFLILLSKNKQDEEVDGYILYKSFSAKLKENYSELLNNLGHRYFFLLTEYVFNIDNNFSKGEESMNKDFIEIAKRDGNIAKIEQIMREGEHLRKFLEAKAKTIIDDILEKRGNSEFKSYVYDKNYKELWAIAKFQYDISSTEKYNFVIDVLVKISGFKISIFDEHKEFESFEKILKKILHEYEKEYEPDDIGDGRRAYYKNPIEFEKSDTLMAILNNILDSFKEYNLKQT